MVSSTRVFVAFASIVVAVVVSPVPSASAAEPTLVVCAPGYPGSTTEAQPAMDALAAAVNRAVEPGSAALSAAYFETEDGGVSRLHESDAALAMVTLPFFLEHRRAFDLEPLLLAVPVGREPVEPWVLVAKVGAIERPSDLDGWTIVGLAGHSPSFVRGPVLGDWGVIPRTTVVEFSGAVLSNLRRAVTGEPVAVLLDAEQAAALDRLPFADKLEVVHRSPALPVSVLCAVGDRVAAADRARWVEAFEGLDEGAEAAEALAGVRLERFEPLQPELVVPVEAAFDEAAE